jgi:uncharacterized protein (TIGR03435 family)
MNRRSRFVAILAVSATPALFGATAATSELRELGLRLDSQKGPVEILVVDRAERPVEN